MNTTKREYYEIQARQATVRSENDFRYNWFTLKDAQAALESLKNKDGCKIVFVQIIRTEKEVTK